MHFETAKARLWMTISLYLLMFTYAISFTVVGPLIPEFMRQFNISTSQSGLITAFQGLGGLIALAVGAAISDRVKKSIMVILTFSIYALSMTSIPLLRAFAPIVAVFFLIGASTRTLDAMLNAVITEMHGARRGIYISLLQAMFGLGALAAPIIANALLGAAVPAVDVFLYLGLWCLIAFTPFLVLLKRLPRQNTEAVQTGNALGATALFKNWRFLMLCLVMFLYVGMSSSLATWLPSYMTGTLLTTKLYSALPISLYWVGAIIGRIAFSFIGTKHWVKTLQTSLIFASGLLFIPAVLMHSPLLAVIGCGLIGLACSMLAPFAISTAGTYFPNRAGGSASLLIMSATAGQMVLPYLNGLFIDVAGFTAGMLFPAFICLLQCVPLILLPKVATVNLPRTEKALKA